MSNIIQELVANGFELIGVNSRGFKIYAKLDVLDNQVVILHKVNKEGISMGIAFLEKETIEIIFKSGLLV